MLSKKKEHYIKKVLCDYCTTLIKNKIEIEIQYQIQEFHHTPKHIHNQVQWEEEGELVKDIKIVYPLLVIAITINEYNFYNF